MDKLIEYTKQLNHIEYEKKKKRFPHLCNINNDTNKKNIIKENYDIKLYKIKLGKKKYFDMIRNKNKNKNKNTLIIKDFDKYFNR